MRLLLFQEHQVLEKYQLQNSEGLVRGNQSVSWTVFSSGGLTREESTSELSLVVGRVYFPAAVAWRPSF